ncbi:hypothetical protein OXT66_02035 [Lentilactobacillus senioris]|uniref:hypothetical protein n=1 Tax=Lentilactobacillus senioris TaxID=931534 RepID=UPI00227F0B9F|nr:hypothetical protein [Lentilactobacillus senioris]MCY9806326.1 hypothetical protein [Lentilactobacillus senioris]
MATEIKNYAQTVLDQASDGHNYHWVGEYQGRPYEPILISHDNHCGAVFLISPEDFANGKRCYLHQHCGWHPKK